MTYLQIITSEGTTRIEFDGPKVTLGRHANNTVRLQDNQVSRFHLEIERAGSGYVVRDLGSRNGTLLAGQPIQEAPLKPGQEVQLGYTRLQLVVDGAEQAEQPKAAAAEPVPEAVGAAAEGSGGGGSDDDSGMITLDESPAEADEEDSGPVMRARTDFAAGSLEALATVGQEVPFGPNDLSLVNARGDVVHAADKNNSATAETLKVLRTLLYACVRAGASDLHLEPKQEEALIRLRVDGTMVETARLKPDIAKRLHQMVKILCDIDIAKRATVQEGHFCVHVPGRRIDYRVSCTPSMFGEKLVVRVLDPVSCPQHLHELDLPGWMEKQIKGVSRQDQGMVLVCGPTGSGKTTTLYAVLRQIDTYQRNVITIEDPIEYELPGATQIPVDESQGNTFNSLLRSVLRQDPDVLVLGEIRDKETATTAMQAATTGHLVLSTIHAKDTIGTIFRLLDLGVEPYLVASTLNLVLAQRLPRILCPQCKLGRRPTPTQSLRLGRSVEGVKEIYTPGECPTCFGTGYSGRQAIFEMLTASDEIRDVVLKNPDIASLKKAIEMTMFVPLKEAGLDLVRKGHTALDEVDRVIGVE